VSNPPSLSRCPLHNPLRVCSRTRARSLPLCLSIFLRRSFYKLLTESFHFLLHSRALTGTGTTTWTTACNSPASTSPSLNRESSLRPAFRAGRRS
jgi:hypothetical protein